MIFVPITHGLVHAATVHTAGQVAHVHDPVTKERGACPHFQVVDVAVQGLVHSEDELRHATKSPSQVLQRVGWAKRSVPTTLSIRRHGCVTRDPRGHSANALLPTLRL